MGQVRIGPRNLGIIIGQKRKGPEGAQANPRKPRKFSDGEFAKERPTSKVNVQSGDELQQPLSHWLKQKRHANSSVESRKTNKHSVKGLKVRDEHGVVTNLQNGEITSMAEEAGLSMPPTSPC